MNKECCGVYPHLKENGLCNACKVFIANKNKIDESDED